MVFSPPSVSAQLLGPPDSISIADFRSSNAYGRYPLAQARSPFVCGLTGKAYTAAEIVEREKDLAKAIVKRLDLRTSAPSGIESLRSSLQTLYMAHRCLAFACAYYLQIDYIPLTHAVHRLSGIVAPANPASTALELGLELRSSGSVALFACVPLLQITLAAAKARGTPNDRIFILPMHSEERDHGLTTIYDLIEEGKKMPDLKPLPWPKGQGERQVAETIQSLSELYPHWHLGQVYGMTETAVVITSTSESNILHGSSGSLLPSMKAKIISADGSEVTTFETPGELFVQDPRSHWGDEAVVRRSAQGHEHFVIIDRIKELIKVKGIQVAPAELEAYLLTHPFVSDYAII
ncbi:hypothetical protein ACJZ2D_004383 [Fusarium nematophilum]